jgi:hypothetical protein
MEIEKKNEIKKFLTETTFFRFLIKGYLHFDLLFDRNQYFFIIQHLNLT